jgi:predicted ATPase/uncharacterized protein HemY
MRPHIPRFENTDDNADELATFVCLLRKAVFYSRDEAAAYFQLNPSTITSYESGRIKQVPLGYLAGLALLLVARYEAKGLVVNPAELQTQLLLELNKAIKTCLKKSQPFQGWSAVTEIAGNYLIDQQKKRSGTEIASQVQTTGEKPSVNYALASRHAGSEEPTLKVVSFNRSRTNQHPTTNRDSSVVPVPSQTTPPNNLLHPLTSFVGREKSLADLQELLGKYRLITLTGPGGIGKTRLALELASSWLTNFPGGVWLVELALLTEANQIEQALVETVGLKEQPGQAALVNLIEYFKEQRVLLLLDNCEHLIEGSARLAASLLKNCPQLVILATSREPLNISGEKSYLVPTLALPLSQQTQVPQAQHKDNALTTLIAYPAISLFIDRAQSASNEFQLNQEIIGNIVEICCKMDGLPLAIELAAARVRTFPPDKLLERLNLKLLAGGARDLPVRQQTLKRAIDWSYELLSEDEQYLFRRLGIFAGGCTLEAAEKICQDLSHFDVLEGLDSLVLKSLLKQPPVETGNEMRYSMLQTIQEYALEKLEASPEAQTVALNQANYYVEWAEKLGEKLKVTGLAIIFKEFDSEYINLRAVINRSLTTGNAEAALRIATALNQYWQTRGYYTEGRDYLERAMKKAGETVAIEYRAAALVVLGWLCYLQGDYSLAHRYHQQGLELGQLANKLPVIAEAINGLGGTALAKGDYNLAIAYFEESLRKYRELGYLVSVGTQLNNLAVVFTELEKYEEARQYLEEGLALVSKLGPHRLTANILNNLAIVAGRLGDFANPRQYLEKSLEIWRKLDNKAGMALNLTNLGQLCTYIGEYVISKEYLEEGLALRREIGDRTGIANTFFCLGWLSLYSQNDYSLALPYFEESLSLGRTLDDKLAICNALFSLGFTLLSGGIYNEAGRYFEEGLLLSRAIGNPKMIATNLVGLAALVNKGWWNNEQPLPNYDNGEPDVKFKEIADYRAFTAHVLGAIWAWHRKGGTKMEPFVEACYEQLIEALKDYPGITFHSDYSQAFAKGQITSLVECADYVILFLKLRTPG